MSDQMQDSYSRSGIARVVPRWYMDLDAALKPIVSSLGISFITIPLLIWAFIASRHAASTEKELNGLLAAGGAPKLELLSLVSDMHAATNTAQKAMLITSSYAFLSAVLIAYVVSSLTVVWLRKLISDTDRVASGDLTVSIERDNGSQIGDIQEAIGKMVASFRATINRIELAAKDLKTAAGEMAQTSDEAGHAIGEVAQAISSISEGAVHQVDLVTGTSDVVAEIESSVRIAAEHSAEARRQSADTEALTEEGVRRATEIQDAMQSVRETSIATSAMVRSLGEKSTNIDQIVNSITDIAAQTNLLALNAAIEAARAGEQGRGFAVVAEEVRKLAEDAQNSTGKIATLIDEIREQTEQAMTAMDAGLETVEAGFESVNRNRQAFFDISGAVRALHQSSDEISTLTTAIANDAGSVREQIEEVASVAEESSASTEQVSASTEQTSAAAEEVTAAAARVAATAESLAEIAGRFKVLHGVTSLNLARSDDDGRGDDDADHSPHVVVGGAA